jgi:hypothetical protein
MSQSGVAARPPSGEMTRKEAGGNGPAPVPPAGYIDCQRARAVPRDNRRIAVSTPGATAEACNPRRSPALSPPGERLLRSLWTDDDDVHTISARGWSVKPLPYGSSGSSEGAWRGAWGFRSEFCAVFPGGRGVFPRGNAREQRGNDPFPGVHGTFPRGSQAFPVMCILRTASAGHSPGPGSRFAGGMKRSPAFAGGEGWGMGCGGAFALCSPEGMSGEGE